jgi:hypothetical protein
MLPSRRFFLRNAALSLLAVKLPFSAFAQNHLNGQGNDFDPESLALFAGVSRQTFEPWIGSRFRLSLNNKSLGSLVLLSVREISGDAKEAPDDATEIPRAGPAHGASHQSAITSFSLRFQGTGAALPQNTYMLAHDWLGSFPLFLVPSGRKGTGSTYTAVITLLPVTELKK